MIQTIIETKSDDIITKFNQLNNKNYLYFFSYEVCYEFNIKNGKINEKKISINDNYGAKLIGKYIINYLNKVLYIKNKDNELIYEKKIVLKVKYL